MLHVIEEVTIILITVWSLIFLPLASSIFYSVCEVANIAGPVLPLVVSLSVGFTELVLTCVRVTILVTVASLTVFETSIPLSLIAISIFPLVHTVAVDLTFLPLSDIGITIRALPDSKTLLDAGRPFSIVYLTIRPGESAFPVYFIIQVLADVG